MQWSSSLHWEKLFSRFVFVRKYVTENNMYYILEKKILKNIYLNKYLNLNKYTFIY